MLSAVPSSSVMVTTVPVSAGVSLVGYDVHGLGAPVRVQSVLPMAPRKVAVGSKKPSAGGVAPPDSAGEPFIGAKLGATRSSGVVMRGSTVSVFMVAAAPKVISSSRQVAIGASMSEGGASTSGAASM